MAIIECTFSCELVCFQKSRSFLRLGATASSQFRITSFLLLLVEERVQRCRVMLPIIETKYAPICKYVFCSTFSRSSFQSRPSSFTSDNFVGCSFGEQLLSPYLNNIYSLLFTRSMLRSSGLRIFL